MARHKLAVMRERAEELRRAAGALVGVFPVGNVAAVDAERLRVLYKHTCEAAERLRWAAYEEYWVEVKDKAGV